MTHLLLHSHNKGDNQINGGTDDDISKDIKLYKTRQY